MGQYFDNDDNLASETHDISFVIEGKKYLLRSDNGVFSKDGLDEGTRLLLETIIKTDLPLGDNILDLGCGIGPIGLVLASLHPDLKVTCSDINKRAIQLTQQNAIKLAVNDRVQVIESDVYSNIASSFSAIVTNPPIRAGKKVTYAMYEGAVSHLSEGGFLLLVIRKKQGAESCQKFLEGIFGQVSVLAKKKGYLVLIAKKQGVNHG